jgi:hypothetical protein
MAEEVVFPKDKRDAENDGEISMLPKLEDGDKEWTMVDEVVLDESGEEETGDGRGGHDAGGIHFVAGVVPLRGAGRRRAGIDGLDNADWRISSRSKLVSPISYFGNADNSRGGGVSGLRR